MSSGDGATALSKKAEFLNELISEIEDPIHKRILKAYKPGCEIESMEAELRQILMEIVQP